MKIEYRKVNGDMLQITTADERWYGRMIDEATETYEFVPSNTWICSFWPKGKGFEKWLKDNGDEAENLKKEAGNKGSKVHQAIEDLLNGVEVKFDAKYMNHDAGREEELTADEYATVMTFVAWWEELNANHKVEILSTEYTVWNDGLKVAATLDLKIAVDGVIWVVDYKTSAAIYMSHRLQVHLMKVTEQADKGFILQLNYKLNKNKYKLTEIEEDLTEDYAACMTIWKRETAGTVPAQKDYPLSLKVSNFLPPKK